MHSSSGIDLLGDESGLTTAHFHHNFIAPMIESTRTVREVRKEVVETLLEDELSDHLDFEKHDKKDKAAENVGTI